MKTFKCSNTKEYQKQKTWDAKATKWTLVILAVCIGMVVWFFRPTIKDSSAQEMLGGCRAGSTLLNGDRYGGIYTCGPGGIWTPKVPKPSKSTLNRTSL